MAAARQTVRHGQSFLETLSTPQRNPAACRARSPVRPILQVQRQSDRRITYHKRHATNFDRPIVNITSCPIPYDSQIPQPTSPHPPSPTPYPLPPTSYPLPSISYPLFPISYLLSPTSYLLSSTSYFLSPPSAGTVQPYSATAHRVREPHRGGAVSEAPDQRYAPAGR